MRILQAAKRVIRYVRHDLREIALPASLPDPPDYVPPRKLTWSEIWQAISEGTTEYLDSWKRQPEEGPGEKTEQEKEATLMEELAATARTTSSLRPLLTKLYHSQMNTYQKVVTNFIQGYKEGAAEKVDLSDIFPDLPSDTASKPAASAATSRMDAAHNAADSTSSHPPSADGCDGESQAVPSADAPLADDEATARRLSRPSREAQATVSRAASGSNAEQAESLSSADAPLSDDEPVARSLRAESRAKQDMLSSLIGAFENSKRQSMQDPQHNSPPPQDDQVSNALQQAEQLAAKMMGSGSAISPEQRKELEVAIEKAEVAMRAAASRIDPGNPTQSR